MPKLTPIAALTAAISIDQRAVLAAFLRSPGTKGAQLTWDNNVISAHYDTNTDTLKVITNFNDHTHAIPRADVPALIKALTAGDKRTLKRSQQNPLCLECLKKGLSINLYRDGIIDNTQRWLCRKSSKNYPNAIGCGKTTYDSPTRKAVHRPAVDGVAVRG